MPSRSEEIVVLPPGYDPDKLESYRRRIERFQERQLAARAHSIQVQRRFRLFVAVVIAGLVVTAGVSAYVAYSLGQLRASVAAQLQSAEAAVAVSNQRWQETSRALAANRAAVESGEQLLARFRAESRAALLLPFVDTYLDQLRASGRFDPAENPALPAKLKEAVQAALARELAQNPDAPDAQLLSEIHRIVDARVPRTPAGR
jgi:hypothetical protein